MPQVGCRDSEVGVQGEKLGYSNCWQARKKKNASKQLGWPLGLRCCQVGLLDIGLGLACSLALGCSLGIALVGFGLGPEMGPQNKQKWA